MSPLALPSWVGARRSLAVLLGYLLALWWGAGLAVAADDPPQERISLVLLTLDTTRADRLGAYGDSTARTPHLDALAGRGTRYARALTPSPLTLPSHASILTGLDPLEHGVRDNGTAALAPGLPTLATVLQEQGYATGAMIASRVLDRRFGLAAGFDHYDDRMAAEAVGEYGYPEREASAVTDAALSWLADQPATQPVFLWVHYYDPHAPYRSPNQARGASPEAAYAGEIEHMDRQIGRLVEALADRPVVIAAVGDHGEALGEHGERTHGIFLYRAVLEVPLILAGVGVPAGRVVDGAVSTRALAPTLLRLLAVDEAPLAKSAGGGADPVLPGIWSAPDGAAPDGAARPPVYSESRLPATAYGWSPLKALSDERFRLIVAPRPELYDFIADPAESRNLIRERRAEARGLLQELERYESAAVARAPARPELDPELASSLESLGYLSGQSGAREGELDPKDGIALLADFEEAKSLATAGRLTEAIARFESLSARSPGNVPFLTRLAGALLAAGRGDEAIASYRRAIELHPALDFSHLHLANALHHLGRAREAEAAYRKVLELNPRFAAAWLALAEAALRAGKPDEERRLLRQAAAAGTASAALLVRLGQVEMAAGEPATAAARLEEATELTPGWPLPWLIRGQIELERGRSDAARRALERVLVLAPRGPEGRQARQLLGSIHQ